MHILPEGFIMLESVKMPGHFVNVSKNGRSKAPASVALNDPEGQFTIRVTVSCKKSQYHQQPLSFVYNIRIFVYTYVRICIGSILIFG